MASGKYVDITGQMPVAKCGESPQATVNGRFQGRTVARANGGLLDRRTAAWYSFAELVLAGSRFGGSLVVISWVLPEEMGLWKTLVLVKTYAMLAQSGVNNGLSRELPFFLGADKPERVRRFASTALFVNLVSAGLAAVGFGIALVYGALQGFSSRTMLGIATVLVISVEQFYLTYVSVTFRANKEFLRLAKVSLILTIFTVVTVPLVYFFGFNGLLLRAVLTTTANVVLLHLSRPVRVRPSWETESFITLLKTGLPIFILAYLSQVSATFDKAILLRRAGLEAVGLYAPAAAAFAGMLVFRQILGRYLYPQMSYSLGKNGDARLVLPWVWKSAVFMVLGSLPLVAVGWGLIPPAIRHFYPAYEAGIRAAQWGMVAGVLRAAQVGVNLLNSMKAFASLTVVTIAMLGFSWGIPWVLSYSTTPLNGVALGFALAQAMTLVVTLLVTHVAAHRQQAR